MTPTQEQMIRQIEQIARNAIDELGPRASLVVPQRPTVQELNNTVDRLNSIANLAAQVFA